MDRDFIYGFEKIALNRFKKEIAKRLGGSASNMFKSLGRTRNATPGQLWSRLGKASKVQKMDAALNAVITR